MARILVIEDDQSYRSMLRYMIERAGHQVVDASNGVNGLAIYRDEPADLVITDIFMPHKGGLDIIRQLREVDPDVKVIAISGSALSGPEDHLEAASEMGAHRVFSKPFRRAELLAAIDDVLSGKPA